MENKNGLSTYCDFLPNHAKNDYLKPGLKQGMIDNFSSQVDDVIRRLGELPIYILYFPFGEYIPLLKEAREIYTRGYYYSCVAMCGITMERLVKDILRGSIMLRTGADTASAIDGPALDQLERVDASSLGRFLFKASIIDKAAWQALSGMVELRNSYAHARGENPEEDALKSIKYLHDFIDRTTSVLRDHEIVQGMLVPKGQQQKSDIPIDSQPSGQ